MTYNHPQIHDPILHNQLTTVHRTSFTTYITPMDPWRLLGHARTTFHAHSSPLSIPPKNPSANPPTNLADFCKQATPPCILNPFLFNGHLQTFYTALSSYDIPIYYRRRIFTATDPAFAGTFTVDFLVGPYDEGKAKEEEANPASGTYDGDNAVLPPRTKYYTNEGFSELRSLDTKPMVIILHGLSGGSHEIYLRHVLKPLADAGWEACVVNSRGCAGSEITTGVLYNARATWDVRQVVKWARERWPNRPIFGLGFSLGANILVNVRTILYLYSVQCELRKNEILPSVGFDWAELITRLMCVRDF